MDPGMLKRWWPAFSRHLDDLLDLVPAQRKTWLGAQNLDPELRQLLEAALTADDAASPLDYNPIGGNPVDGVVAGEDLAGANRPGPESGNPADAPWRRQLGAWRIVRPLGEGGSASVFLAERVEAGFRQEAALKLLRSGVLDPIERARFAQERELLAGLKHPGIARLIDGGVSPEGAPFLVIEYVDGESITQWCARGKLDLDARLALFRSACDAVHHAHRNLIVHRDLKPGNIMVDTEGHVKLLDFGIARLLDDGRAHTRTEARRLTLAYAAPEQIDGGAVTTAIDVHAMGVLLHELVTGDLPVRAGKFGGTRAEPRHAWVDAGPVDRGLIAIIENAIDVDPEQRYASIAAFADDLQRFRDGLTVRARGTSRWYRVGRTLRRHWGVIAATALVLGVVTTSAVVAWREAATARQIAAREVETRAFLVDLLASAAPERASGAKVDVAELIARGAERAEDAFPDAPLARADLLLVCGRLLNSLGRYEEAEHTVRQALVIERGFAAWQEQGRPESRLALARVLRDRNRLGEAMDIVSMLIRDLRTDSDAAALLGQALILDGSMRSRAGGDTAGIPLLEEGLGMLRRIQGFDPHSLRDGEREYGEALARAGRSNDALVVWRLVLATTPKQTLARSRLLLSIGYAEQRRGDYAAARSAMTEALAIQRAVLPSQHSDTSQTLTALGVLESAIGNEELALQWHREALAMREQVFGANSIEAGESQIAVAVTLHALDRADEGFAAFERGIERLKSSPEPQPERIAWALANHAAALRKNGRFTQAVAVAKEAVDLIQATLPKDHESRLIFELEWVRTLRDARRFDEADAVAIAAERDAESPVLRRRFRIALAEVARDRGEWAKAMAHYRVVTNTEPPKAMPVDHAEAWRGLANVLRLAGESEAAADAKARAMALFAQFLPKAHPRWKQLQSE